MKNTTNQDNTQTDTKEVYLRKAGSVNKLRAAKR